MAQQWRNVGDQVQSAVKASIGQVSIPGSSSRTAKMEVTDHGEVNYLEHVQAHVTIEAARRGDLSIYLTSPHGTKSQLLARRPHDSSRAGFHDWPFLTVFCWGENPAGTWQLEIQNEGRYDATLTAWSMTFHGTKEDPDKVALPDSKPTPAPAPTAAPVKPVAPKIQPQPQPAVPQPTSEAFIKPQEKINTNHARVTNCVSVSASAPDYCESCEVGFKTLAGRCVKECPVEGFYEGVANSSSSCLSCYYTCHSCSGPNDYECLSCYGDAALDSSSALGKYCHNKHLVSKVVGSSNFSSTSPS